MILDFKELGICGARELKKRGADYGDLFFEKRFTFSAKCEDNRIENVSCGIEIGVGIRYIKNFKTYYGFTNKLTEESIKEVIENLAAASLSEKEVVLDFNVREQRYCQFVNGTDFDVPVEKKIELLLRANEVARSYGDRVKQVTVVLRDSLQEITIVNTNGDIVEDVRPRVVFYTLVVASDGRVLQTGYEPVGHLGDSSLFEEYPPEKVAKLAAERALKMLKAKPAPAGKFTVVISSKAGGTMIHEAVGHGLEADLADQKLSVYSGKVGEQVASELITVIDNGSMPGKYGSSGYDDEGVATQKNVLIENGILKCFMYDLTEAMKSGKFPTGNGRRQSYMHVPIPRMTNTYIAPGETDPEEIIKDTKKGIFVVKMGGGQVNTVNGDFIFEVSEGYLIENGEVTEPIRGVSLIGNGPKVLKEIDAVGNDLGFAIGTCGKDGQGVPVSDGLPTIRIPEITVGGTK
ncbi:peptidase U62 modulator of DNA gyrase [Desulfurobacterium thermolithotrophum DSM 11699]|uniref:Peptidase U62 modulator of DNA gyrase n=1 Tax=Desulfurobacterium thermolithotrophum (strain DSM 11699 / BSA) TaxID=868864 RepID=F0S391_DESTD|nr:TldD/PmbA family protein [Desulfurobacterium thermolithotrophum]ADY73313.1 peptidase U62 modulator of DNA gyrase [Desulfurobacterium thermolithotrophum DSM 11699]